MSGRVLQAKNRLTEHTSLKPQGVDQILDSKFRKAPTKYEHTSSKQAKTGKHLDFVGEISHNECRTGIGAESFPAASSVDDDLMGIGTQFSDFQDCLGPAGLILAREETQKS